MDPSRDKLLLVFNSKENVQQHKHYILERLFQLDPSSLEGEKIIKGLTWENKYIAVTYDLYIDEYGTLEEWLTEFGHYDCDVLREVLSAIIIVDDFNNGSDTTEFMSMCKKLKKCNKGNNIFNIMINCGESFVEPTLEQINDSFYADMDQTSELINLNRTLTRPSETLVEVNEYGEKINLARAIELIDTLDWDGCAKYMKTQKWLPEGQLRQEDTPTENLNFSSIINKLQVARAKFENSKNAEDAQDLADELAEELSKLV